MTRLWAEMTARERDALVAEKVLGHKLDYEFADVPALRDQYDEWGALSEYTTDIAAAWGVVEKLEDRGTIIRIGPWLPGRYCAYLSYAPRYLDSDAQRFIAGSPAEAICLAALKAVGVEV